MEVERPNSVPEFSHFFQRLFYGHVAHARQLDDFIHLLKYAPAPEENRHVDEADNKHGYYRIV